MTDMKINSTSTGYPIPTVPGNNSTREVLIKLAVTNKYDVYQKDLPANLPANYDWINNFGIKERPKDPRNSAKTIPTTDADPYSTNVDAYTIELDDVAGKEPVYFDGSGAHNFPTKKTSVGNNRIHVTLALGDPPIGWPK
jgi:hypothetical protein